MEQCPFCLISNKKLESVILYEDPHVMAVLDIFPNVPGQAIVFPRRHIKYIWELSDEDLIRLFMLAKEIAKSIKSTLNAEGISIYIPMDEIAGQRIGHFFVYIFPRYKDDKFICSWQRNKVDIKVLQDIASKIMSHISVSVGEKQEVIDKEKNLEVEDVSKKLVWYLRKP